MSICLRSMAWGAIMLAPAVLYLAQGSAVAGKSLTTSTLVELDQRLRSLRSEFDGQIEFGIWLGNGCGKPLYTINDATIMPAASSIKTALLIEFFAENETSLGEVFAATSGYLADPTAPSIRHFDRKTQDDIRQDLVGLTARELGEAMINKSHVSSNAAYNAAANVIIAALGGPLSASQKIHRRHDDIEGLSVSRYMLADRHASGDNLVSLKALANIHRSVATRTLPAVRATTIDAIRDVLEIDSNANGQHYYKGGSLTSDPQVRIEAGWIQSDDKLLIYAIGAYRLQNASNGEQPYEQLRSGVESLSRIVLTAAPEQ